MKESRVLVSEGFDPVASRRFVGCRHCRLPPSLVCSPLHFLSLGLVWGSWVLEFWVWDEGDESDRGVEVHGVVEGLRWGNEGLGGKLSDVPLFSFFFYSFNIIAIIDINIIIIRVI